MKLSLPLNPVDRERIRLAMVHVQCASFSAFAMKAVFQQVRQIESEIGGTVHDRNRLMILNFVQQGCRSVEDIRSESQALTALEIEGHLFSLTQNGLLERDDAKRGRTWHWHLTDKGLEFLRTKGLAE